MQKFLYLLAIVIFVIIQTEPAYCQASKTASFQLSVTIPEHVTFNDNIGATPLLINTHQLIQTQTVIRDNKTISLTSIVVP